MTITLNGTAHDLPQALPLTELLARLGLRGKPVVIEHNHQALLPREHATTVVQDGDVIEIVQITAGG